MELGSEVIDEEAEMVWPYQREMLVGAMNERGDGKVQWVRACVEDTMAETQHTTESVEDLWFFLQQDQQAALQMMMQVMGQSRQAAQTST